MPAGPEPSTTAAVELPDYPTFYKRLIDDCHRLGAPVPEERLIEAEYVHRQRELDAAKAAEAAWNATHREGADQL